MTFHVYIILDAFDYVYYTTKIVFIPCFLPLVSKGSITTYIGPMHSFKTGQLFGVKAGQRYAESIAKTLGVDALYHDVLIGKPLTDDRDVVDEVVVLHSKAKGLPDISIDFQY